MLHAATNEFLFISCCGLHHHASNPWTRLVFPPAVERCLTRRIKARSTADPSPIRACSKHA